MLPGRPRLHPAHCKGSPICPADLYTDISYSFPACTRPAGSFFVSLFLRFKFYLSQRNHFQSLSYPFNRASLYIEDTFSLKSRFLHFIHHSSPAVIQCPPVLRDLSCLFFSARISPDLLKILHQFSVPLSVADSFCFFMHV